MENYKKNVIIQSYFNHITKYMYNSYNLSNVNENNFKFGLQVEIRNKELTFISNTKLSYSLLCNIIRLKL